MVQPTKLDCIRRACRDVSGDPNLDVYICHGEPFCQENKDGLAPVACRWCHVIIGHDPRSPEQIELEIEAQQRGH